MSGSISGSSSTGSSPVQEIVDNGNVRRDESEDLYSTARVSLPVVGEHENIDNENVRRDESEDLYSTAPISFSDRQEGIPVEAEHEESQDLYQIFSNKPAEFFFYFCCLSLKSLKFNF